MYHGVQKAFLKRVFRVFVISGNPQGNVENSLFVTFAEFSEGSWIPL
jgi:hypothetical protein